MPTNLRSTDVDQGEQGKGTPSGQDGRRETGQTDKHSEGPSFFKERPELIASLFKTCSWDDDRYSGAATDSFERKLMLSVDRFDRADISDEDRHIAFYIVLCDAD